MSKKAETLKDNKQTAKKNAVTPSIYIASILPLLKKKSNYGY